MSEDADLAARYRAGDNDAFAELYERYVRRIYDFIYYKTHHKQTAEDLVSQTFFQAMSNISSFDPKKGVFSAWLHRIARNLVIDHYRASKTLIDIEDAWDLPSSSDVPRDADAALKIEKVRAFLKTLSSDQREIVQLRLWQDLPFKEIAAITGKSEAACKMAYGRATSKLREDVLFALLISFFLLH